ncbi:glycosyltransferase [Erysipelothrix sp. HDW6B]|uniref:glycosyltransferase n=1 Tax=Erysipelothrix sp. HDW6B TaxID=2714929 RepID=UPI00140C0665|nr:glycosyltransferase [Erysipelothrix sp. HDW6B]QIK86860.1 glycosyltransferase [Erysipelothrix sp. HDW6B]
MNKGENFKSKLFYCTFFLFIFQMINREFVPIIDLRFVIIGLSIVLIAIGADSLKKIKDSFTQIMVILFFVYSLISITFIFRTPYVTDKIMSISKNVAILYVYMTLITLTMYVYKDKISLSLLYKSVLVSMIFNFATSIVLYINMDANGASVKLPFTDIKGYVFGKNNYNAFGQNFRLAGYSEDANYLSINSAILILLTHLYFQSKPKNIRILSAIPYGIGLILLLLAASKTVIVTLVGVIVLLILIRRFKGLSRLMQKLNFTHVILLFLGATVVLGMMYKQFSVSDSLTNRFLLWNRGLSLFTQYPIFGSGASGYRHFGTTINWVVHPHNTYLQVISELGLVGIVIFVISYSSALNGLRNEVLKSTAILFLISMMTFDISVVVYTVFLLVIIPIVDNNLRRVSDETTVVMLSNGLSNGGAERMVYDLCEGLSDNMKYQIHLVLTDPDDPNNTVKDLFDRENINFTIHEISTKKHAVLSNNFKISNIIREIKPDIVHTHQITLIYCIIGYIFSGSFIKVHTVHNDSHLEFGSKGFRQVYHVLFVLFRINLVSISEYIMSTSMNEYNHLDNVYHHNIYNGRTIEIDRSNRSDLLNSNFFEVIMVGRLTTVKNHVAAVEAMNLIVNDEGIQSIRLKIYGEGPERGTIEDQISKYKLENYVFLEGVTSEIPQKLEQSDVFLMTSVHEGFPISAIEALTAGLPLILSEFGSAFELIKSNGYIVDRNNYREIALKIMNLNADTDLYEQYSKNSRELAKKFEKKSMVSEYSDLYQALMRR